YLMRLNFALSTLSIFPSSLESLWHGEVAPNIGERYLADVWQIPDAFEFCFIYIIHFPIKP
ncbi:hypothetical protein M2R47_09440, partial [Moraxella sp. Tifton1]|uniref:hypothetical protein n=1 Tax=Moraxella oculi TaxID=2940516 RepID=UPI002012D2C1